MSDSRISIKDIFNSQNNNNDEKDDALGKKTMMKNPIMNWLLAATLAILCG